MTLNKDKIVNIIEIVWNYDLVYIFKIGIVIFMCYTVQLSTSVNMSTNMLPMLPMLTFAGSLFIDCIVAGIFVKNNLKGFLIIHSIFFVIFFIGLIYALLVYTKQIELCDSVINNCNNFSKFCCISPLLELLYDINSHLQNENNNNYN